MSLFDDEQFNSTPDLFDSLFPPAREPNVASDLLRTTVHPGIRWGPLHTWAQQRFHTIQEKVASQAPLPGRTGRIELTPTTDAYDRSFTLVKFFNYYEDKASGDIRLSRSPLAYDLWSHPESGALLIATHLSSSTKALSGSLAMRATGRDNEAEFIFGVLSRETIFERFLEDPATIFHDAPKVGYGPSFFSATETDLNRITPPMLFQFGDIYQMPQDYYRYVNDPQHNLYGIDKLRAGSTDFAPRERFQEKVRYDQQTELLDTLGAKVGHPEWMIRKNLVSDVANTYGGSSLTFFARQEAPEGQLGAFTNQQGYFPDPKEVRRQGLRGMGRMGNVLGEALPLQEAFAFASNTQIPRAGTPGVNIYINDYGIIGSEGGGWAMPGKYWAGQTKRYRIPGSEYMNDAAIEAAGYRVGDLWGDEPTMSISPHLTYRGKAKQVGDYNIGNVPWTAFTGIQRDVKNRAWLDVLQMGDFAEAEQKHGAETKTQAQPMERGWQTDLADSINPNWIAIHSLPQPKKMGRLAEFAQKGFEAHEEGLPGVLRDLRAAGQELGYSTAEVEQLFSVHGTSIPVETTNPRGADLYLRAATRYTERHSGITKATVWKSTQWLSHERDALGIEAFNQRYAQWGELDLSNSEGAQRFENYPVPYVAMPMLMNPLMNTRSGKAQLSMHSLTLMGRHNPEALSEILQRDREGYYSNPALRLTRIFTAKSLNKASLDAVDMRAFTSGIEDPHSAEGLQMTFTRLAQAYPEQYLERGGQTFPWAADIAKGLRPTDFAEATSKSDWAKRSAMALLGQGDLEGAHEVLKTYINQSSVRERSMSITVPVFGGAINTSTLVPKGFSFVNESDLAKQRHKINADLFSEPGTGTGGIFSQGDIYDALGGMPSQIMSIEQARTRFSGLGGLTAPRGGSLESTETNLQQSKDADSDKYKTILLNVAPGTMGWEDRMRRAITEQGQEFLAFLQKTISPGQSIGVFGLPWQQLQPLLQKSLIPSQSYTNGPLAGLKSERQRTLDARYSETKMESSHPALVEALQAFSHEMIDRLGLPAEPFSDAVSVLARYYQSAMDLKVGAPEGSKSTEAVEQTYYNYLVGNTGFGEQGPSDFKRGRVGAAISGGPKGKGTQMGALGGDFLRPAAFMLDRLIHSELGSKEYEDSIGGLGYSTGLARMIAPMNADEATIVRVQQALVANKARLGGKEPGPLQDPQGIIGILSAVSGQEQNAATIKGFTGLLSNFSSYKPGQNSLAEILAQLGVGTAGAEGQSMGLSFLMSAGLHNTQRDFQGITPRLTSPQFASSQLAPLAGIMGPIREAIDARKGNLPLSAEPNARKRSLVEYGSGNSQDALLSMSTEQYLRHRLSAPDEPRLSLEDEAYKAISPYITSTTQTGMTAGEWLRGLKGSVTTKLRPREDEGFRVYTPSDQPLSRKEIIAAQEWGDTQTLRKLDLLEAGDEASPYKSFSRGGFTGEGAASQPAGVVHAGEYVLTKKDVQLIKDGKAHVVMAKVERDLSSRVPVTQANLMNNVPLLAPDGLPGYIEGGQPGEPPGFDVLPPFESGEVPVSAPRRRYGPRIPSDAELPSEYRTPTGYDVRAELDRAFSTNVGLPDRLLSAYVGDSDPKDAPPPRRRPVSGSGRRPPPKDPFEGLAGEMDEDFGRDDSAGTSRGASDIPSGRSRAFFGLDSEGKRTVFREGIDNPEVIRQHLERRVSRLDKGRAAGAINILNSSDFYADFEQSLAQSGAILTAGSTAFGNMSSGELRQLQVSVNTLKQTENQMKMAARGGRHGDVPSEYYNTAPIIGKQLEELESLGIRPETPFQAALRSAREGDKTERLADRQISRLGAKTSDADYVSAAGLGEFADKLGEVHEMITKVNTGNDVYIKNARETLNIYDTLASSVNKATDALGLAGGDRSRLNDSDREILARADAGLRDQLFNPATAAGISRLRQDTIAQEINNRLSIYDSPEERQAALVRPLLQGGRIGALRRAELPEEAYEEGLDTGLGFPISGRTAINIVGAGARLADRMYGGVRALQRVGWQVVDPMMGYVDAYQMQQAQLGQAEAASGAIDYGQLMSGQTGALLRRQGQAQLLNNEIGRQIYQSYAPLLDNIGGQALGQTVGAGLAIGGPALAATIGVTEMTGNPFAGALAGALVGGGAALNYFSQSTQDVQGMAQTITLQRQRAAEGKGRTYDLRDAPSLIGGGVFGGYRGSGFVAGDVTNALAELTNPDALAKAAKLSDFNADVQSFLNHPDGEAAWQQPGSPWARSDTYNLTPEQFQQKMQGQYPDMSPTEIKGGYLSNLVNINLAKGIPQETTLATYTWQQLYGSDVGMGAFMTEFAGRGLGDPAQLYSGMAGAMGIAAGDQAGQLALAGQINQQIGRQPVSQQPLEVARLQEGASRFDQLNQLRRRTGTPILGPSDIGTGGIFPSDTGKRDLWMQADAQFRQAQLSDPNFARQLQGGGSAQNPDYDFSVTMSLMTGDFTTVNNQLNSYDRARAYSMQLSALSDFAQPAQDQMVAQYRGMNAQQRTQIDQVMGGNRYAATRLLGPTNNAYNLVDLQTGFDPYTFNVNAQEYGAMQSAAQAFSMGGLLAPQAEVQGGSASIQARLLNNQMTSQALGINQQRMNYYIQRQMTMGGALGVDAQGFSVGGDNLQGLQAFFNRQGSAFNVGNGMGGWQLEDAQTRLQRTQQDWGLSQQGQGLALSRQSFVLSGQQYGESYALRQQQFQTGTNYQRTELNIGQEQQLTRMGWSMEDLQFGRSVMDVQFGWQQEDYTRNIRYARGREKRDLMREQQRSTVSYAMQAGHEDVQEERLTEQTRWEKEEFDRKKQYFEQTTGFQKQQIELDKQHFDQNRVLQNQQLVLQEQNHQKNLLWLQQERTFEDQNRLITRQFWEAQSQMNQRFAVEQQTLQLSSTVLNNQLTIMNLAMQTSNNQFGLFTQNMNAYRDALAGINQVAAQLTGLSGGGGIGGAVGAVLGGISGAAGTGVISTPGAGPGGIPPVTGTAANGGGIGAAVGFALGGPTGYGAVGAVAGVVHKREYVVPEGGSLVVRGGASEDLVPLVKQMVQYLQKIADQDPTTFQAIVNGVTTPAIPIPRQSKARFQ